MKNMGYFQCCPDQRRRVERASGERRISEGDANANKQVRRVRSLIATTSAIIIRFVTGFVAGFATVAANAAVKVTDVPYSSRWDTTKSIVYAGVAGVANSSQPTPGTTEFVDSCAWPMAGAPLYPCNTRGIHPNLTFAITFTAEKDGYAGLTYTKSGGATAVPTTVTPTLVTRGNPMTFVTTWREICTAISTANNNSGIDNTCTVTGQGSVAPELTFHVGVYTTTPTTLEESAQITIKVADLPPNNGNESTVDTCATHPEGGVCQFEVLPGDGKIEIRSPIVVSSGTALDKYKMRVLWTEGAGAFVNITSASAHADLDFVANTAGTGNDLANSRIDGFANDVTYSFKVALVDQAGNVGYYTKTGAADTDCGFTLNPNCHEATPGEVFGLLAEDLNCFVATAAYGSTLAPQVETFRHFRNVVLLPNEWGRKFVRSYYEHSPKYARIIQESPILRASARIALWPLLAYAWIAIKFGSVTAFMVLLIGCFSFALAVWAFSKWIRSGRARV